MELNKTLCLDCHNLNRWYSYKWADSAERQEHNRTNNTTCPICGSKSVKNVEDDGTMGPARAAANALFGGKTRP